MDHSTEVVKTAAARWQAVLIRGVVGVVFGAGLVVAVPDVTLKLLAFLWAAYVVTDGVLAAAVAAGRGRAVQRWGWLLFEGLVGVGAGLVAVAWTGTTALGLLITIAVRTALSGLAEVREAHLLRVTIPDELTLGASGVLSIAAGLLMLMAYPGASVRTVLWLIGGHAFAFGVLEGAFGVRLYRWRRPGQATASAA